MLLTVPFILRNTLVVLIVPLILFISRNINSTFHSFNYFKNYKNINSTFCFFSVVKTNVTMENLLLATDIEVPT